MIDLKFSTDEITVETKLEDKLCILHDKSGKGKTLLMSLLKKYSEANHAHYKFFTSNDDASDSLVNELYRSDKDQLIMLTDEIRITPEIANAINDTKAIVLCDIKSYVSYPAKYRKCFGRYILDVTNTSVKLRRIGGENII